MLPVVLEAEADLVSRQYPERGEMPGGARDETGKCAIVDGSFAVDQRPQQPQTGCGPEGAHRLGQALGLVTAQRLIGGGVFSRMRHDLHSTYEYLFIRPDRR